MSTVISKQTKLLEYNMKIIKDSKRINTLDKQMNKPTQVAVVIVR